jgi:hypothetical protein
MKYNSIVEDFFDKQPFAFKTEILNKIKNQLSTIHDVQKQISCKSDVLEEILYNAMSKDGKLDDIIVWKPGSRNDVCDITLVDFKNFIDFYISVKSGTIKNEKLRISGFRLTRFNGSLDKINDYLKNHSQHLTISITSVRYPENWEYQIRYIDEELFTYPKTGNKWIENIGTKGSSKGLITEYRYYMNNGITCFIYPNTSWQIWWEIPLKLIPNKSIIET